jgi:uncharacterized cupredoxin-like copper-binding protein
VLVEALSTGHKVGLGVTAAAFIIFALASAFLFPRIRASYPGRGLPAFIVVSLVFFFGMLAAVENFGAEPSEAGTETAAETTTGATTTEAQPTTTQATTTAATTTVAAPPPGTTTTTAKPKPKPPAAAQTIPVTETEFKITLQGQPKAGDVTFDVKNAGKIPHDFVVQGAGGTKGTPLLNPGQSSKLTVTLKPGQYDLFCSVPGHKQAGMDVKLTVAS